MKKVTSKMKIILVMLVCAAMIIPAAVSAAERTSVLVDGKEYTKGDYTEPEKYLRSSSNFTLHENTTKLEFLVVNGDSSEKNRLSSVRIALLDDKGKVKAVAISPDQLNQNKGIARGTINTDDLTDLSGISLDLKLRGPKNGFIKLYVTEYYEEEGDCPWWDWTCK